MFKLSEKLWNFKNNNISYKISLRVLYLVICSIFLLSCGCLISERIIFHSMEMKGIILFTKKLRYVLLWLFFHHFDWVNHESNELLFLQVLLSTNQLVFLILNMKSNIELFICRNWDEKNSYKFRMKCKF